MRAIIVLVIIAMLSVTGEALKCIKGTYMGYPSADDKILLTIECEESGTACGLTIINWSNGAVSTQRDCVGILHASNLVRSIESNATVRSLTTFFCHTDWCNLVPPRESHNHAHSISLNMIILYFTSCVLLFTMKNLY